MEREEDVDEGGEGEIDSTRQTGRKRVGGKGELEG